MLGCGHAVVKHHIGNATWCCYGSGIRAPGLSPGLPPGTDGGAGVEPWRLEPSRAVRPPGPTSRPVCAARATRAAHDLKFLATIDGVEGHPSSLDEVYALEGHMGSTVDDMLADLVQCRRYAMQARPVSRRRRRTEYRMLLEKRSSEDWQRSTATANAATASNDSDDDQVRAWAEEALGLLDALRRRTHFLGAGRHRR